MSARGTSDNSLTPPARQVVATSAGPPASANRGARTLVTGTVAPEAQIGGVGRVRAHLQVLGNHPGFEQGAAQWMRIQLAHILDAQQPGRQSGVEEIELGCLVQSLVEVTVRRQVLESCS